jgi:hypothetical protein
LLAALLALLSEASADSLPGPITPKTIRKYDRDGDGILNESETKAWQKDADESRQRRAKELARFDANKNGRLDPPERAALHAAAATAAPTAPSDKPASPPAPASPSVAKASAGPHPALAQLVTTDDQGRLRPSPATLPDTPANLPHSEAWLEGYRTRVDHFLRASLTQRFSYNSHFENEKNALGQAMARTLAGDAVGLAKLSEKDANADQWHRRTAGIDYYACFVIKHQPRKYFHFGPLLPPDYLANMKEGARLWTEVNPNRRPSALFKPGSTGYTPEAVNSWVDTRTTDNLSMMRLTAVYLMAEESRSTEVVAEYKKLLERFAIALYRSGNGEWDSENYLGHTITPCFNLYDFARDPAMRALGKAYLDWWLAATAVKYYRGGAAGPNCRDYNHVQPFGGSLAETGWLWFGAPKNPEEVEFDNLHAVTSAYLPPPAIVNLGTQNFDRPRELLNTKPSYRAPQLGDFSEPAAYHETYYYGRTFTLGTLAQGSNPGGDTNGFKLVLDDPERGVADLRFAPTNDPVFTGSALYQKDKISFPNRAAQNRELALFLAKGHQVPWRVSLPLTVRTEVVEKITFLRGATTWAALHPVNLVDVLGPDEEATRGLQFFSRSKRRTVEKIDPATGKTVREQVLEAEQLPRHSGHHALAGQGGADGSFSGFVLEVGEAPAFADYDSFKRAVLAKARLDVSAIAQGKVSYLGAGGRSLAATWGDALADFKVLRDGKAHDWEEHGRYVYRETGKGADGLIHQLRGAPGGALTVNAGGKTFVGTLSKDGAYTSQNK